MDDFLIALIGLLGYGVILLSLETLTRRLDWTAENMRRISHASAAFFAALLSLYLSAPVFVGIVALFVPIMWFSRSRRLLRHIHEVSRPTIGEELLSIGIVVAYIIAGGETKIFVPAILILGIADPLTGIVMQKFKNHVLGYLVFTIVATVVLMFFSIPFFTALLIAGLVAAVERASPYGSDNLTIPVAVALALRLL